MLSTKIYWENLDNSLCAHTIPQINLRILNFQTNKYPSKHTSLHFIQSCFKAINTEDGEISSWLHGWPSLFIYMFKLKAIWYNDDGYSSRLLMPNTFFNTKFNIIIQGPAVKLDAACCFANLLIISLKEIVSNWLLRLKGQQGHTKSVLANSCTLSYTHKCWIKLNDFLNKTIEKMNCWYFIRMNSFLYRSQYLYMK